jgi:hypothetical protein
MSEKLLNLRAGWPGPQIWFNKASRVASNDATAFHKDLAKALKGDNQMEPRLNAVGAPKKS